MKHLIAVLLSASLLFLCACTVTISNDPPTAAQQDSASAGASEAKPFPIKTAQEPLVGITPEPVSPSRQKQNTQKPFPDYTGNPSNLLEIFSAENYRTLNTFLSNFSEAYLYDFDRNKYDPYDLVHFTFIHLSINFPDDVRFEGYDEYVSAARVQNQIVRFFGVNAPTRDVSKYGDTYYYRGDRYVRIAATGEMYPDFSIANRMKDNGDGTYTVDFSAYEIESSLYMDQGIPSSLYSLRDATNSPYPLTWLYDGTAVVEPHTVAGKANYRLISYHKK